jgi:hypothetical protein
MPEDPWDSFQGSLSTVPREYIGSIAEQRPGLEGEIRSVSPAVRGYVAGALNFLATGEGFADTPLSPGDEMQAEEMVSDLWGAMKDLGHETVDERYQWRGVFDDFLRLFIGRAPVGAPPGKQPPEARRERVQGTIAAELRRWTREIQNDPSK